MSKSVVVIGCGVIGVVSALELLKCGHQVTILDPGPPGGEQAASYGNAGWLSVQSVMPSSTPGMWKKVPQFLSDPLGPLAIRPGYVLTGWPWLLRYMFEGASPDRVRKTAGALHALLEGAVPLHQALAQEAGCAELIEAKGLWHVFKDRADFQTQKFGWSVRRDLGIRFEELEGEALRARAPQLPGRYGFGVFIPEAGRCLDPGRYVAALAALAVAKGARLVSARATRLMALPGGTVRIKTSAGAMRFDRVVLAAGAYSRALAASLGDPVPLASERGYHVSVPADGAQFGASYMANDAKMVVNGMAGFVRAAGQVEFAGLKGKPNWNRAEILKRHLAALYPELDLSQARLWLGHRPTMADGRPCIGPSTRAASVIYAFGHGSVGLAAGARTGQLVAQIVSGEAPSIDLAPFAPARFWTKGKA